MDEETKKLLVENNEMLKRLVFFQKLNQIYRVVYWSIIILSAIGAFYFLKPMLENLTSIYTGGAGISNLNSFESLKNLGNKNNIQDLLNN